MFVRKRDYEFEIKCLKDALKYSDDQRWKLWHRVQRLMDYLDVHEVEQEPIVLEKRDDLHQDPEINRQLKRRVSR